MGGGIDAHEREAEGDVQVQESGGEDSAHVRVGERDAEETGERDARVSEVEGDVQGRRGRRAPHDRVRDELIYRVKGTETQARGKCKETYKGEEGKEAGMSR